MAHGDARLGHGHGALPNSSRGPSQILVQMYTRRKNSLIHFSEFLHTHTGAWPWPRSAADNQLFMGLIKLVITINNISGESLVPEPADEAQARGDGD